MIIPNVQSTSVLHLVEIMRLMGIDCMVGCFAELKSFCMSLTRFCCVVMKMCNKNHES